MPSGKYIPKDVTIPIDAPEYNDQRPTKALEQRPNELLAMVLYQKPAPQGQSYDNSKGTERASNFKKQLAVLLRPRPTVSKMQRHPCVAALTILPKVELASVSFSILPLLIGTYSPNPLSTQLVSVLNRPSALPSLPPSSSLISLRSFGPCQAESVLLAVAATPSSVVSPTSDDLPMMVVSMEQEDQTATVADEDRLINVHEDQDAASAGSEVVEESISSPSSVEAQNDSTGQTELQIIEETADDQVSMENDNAFEAEFKTMEEPTVGQTSVGADGEDQPQVQLEDFDTPTDDLTPVEATQDEPVRIEPQSIETPTNGHVSHDIEDEPDISFYLSIQDYKYICTISDEQKVSKAFSIESRSNGSPVDRWGFAFEEEEEEGKEVLRKRESLPAKVLSQFSIAVENRPTVHREDVGSARKETLARQVLKAGRWGRFGVAKARTLCRKVIKEKAWKLQGLLNQQAVPQSGIKADGRMEVDDEDDEIVDADSTEASTSQEADNVDEVMIGSDVEAEMEIDDETPTVVGDCMELEEDNPQQASNEASNQDSMRLEEDNPQQASNEASNQDSMRLEEDNPQSGVDAADSTDPMDMEYQRPHGSVNNGILQDRIQRERAQIALRQTSTAVASSGGLASGSVSALTQSSQQHAAPVSVPETMDAAISMPQGVAHNPTSRNSEADLREARLGKKAESRMVPAEVASTSPSPGVPVTEDGGRPYPTLSILPPESTPSAAASPATQATLTPASTLPSSASSTPPISPLPRNMAPTHNGSPKPASVQCEASAPKKQTRKRHCDSVGDWSVDEEAVAEWEKSNVSQGDQSTPGSGLPTISATRRILLAKPVKRNVQMKPDSETTNPSQPTEKSSAESAEPSKRVQHKRPEKAETDEIVPLNDISDKALTGKSVSWRQLPSPLRH